MSLLLTLLFATVTASAQSGLQSVGSIYSDGGPSIYDTFGVVPPSWDPAAESDRIDDAWLALTLGDHRQALKDVGGAREDLLYALSSGDVDAGTVDSLDRQLGYIEAAAGQMARYWVKVEARDYAAAGKIAAQLRGGLGGSGAPSLYRRALDRQVEQLTEIADRLEDVEGMRDRRQWEASMQVAWELTDEVGEMWSLWRLTDDQLKLVEDRMGEVYADGQRRADPLRSLQP